MIQDSILTDPVSISLITKLITIDHHSGELHSKVRKDSAQNQMELPNQTSPMKKASLNPVVKADHLSRKKKK